MATMYELDETEIHERIIAQDPGAIAAWQEAIMPRVMRNLRYQRGLSEEDAEEVWNDVLLAVVNEAPKLVVDGSSLRKFAFVVARNKAADKWRRDHHRDDASLDVDSAYESLTKPQSKPDERRIKALLDCLEGLKPKYRLILDLQQHGYSASEMVPALGIKVSSVSQTLKRAKDMMAECVTGRLGA
jgi:RNA polymerase sigma factor (sigma-70 family)